MITIKHHKKPNLDICKMTCDKQLDKKLNDYEMTKFLNSHQSTVIIGKPQSGKTSMIYSLFKSKKLLKNVYDKIFIFQPEASRASMKDKIFDKIPDEQKYNELTLENLENMQENLDSEGNNCIIMDDMGAYLKNGDIKKKMKELMFNRRHLHISIYFLVQTWFSIEKDIRKLFSNIIVFRVNKNEMETIFSEVVETHKDNINEIIKVVYNKPYQYLFINVDSQKMFKNFDELIFNE
jgi:hypothetical protein